MTGYTKLIASTYVLTAAALLFSASNVSAEAAKSVTKASAAPAKATTKTSSAKLSLSNVKVLRGTPGAAAPAFVLKTSGVPPLKKVDFASIRPDLAKLLGVAESAVPPPVGAQTAIQVGSTVTVSFASPPSGGYITARDPTAVKIDSTVSPLEQKVLFHSDGVTTHELGFGLPAAPDATYLLTCYSGCFSSQQPLNYRFIEGMNFSGSASVTPTAEGLFFAAFQTAPQSNFLQFWITYALAAEAWFDHCDVMRVK